MYITNAHLCHCFLKNVSNKHNCMNAMRMNLSLMKNIETDHGNFRPQRITQVTQWRNDNKNEYLFCGSIFTVVQCTQS